MIGLSEQRGVTIVMELATAARRMEESMEGKPRRDPREVPDAPYKKAFRGMFTV